MALVDLVLPSSCAGCGRYGALLCTACRAAMVPASRAEDRFYARDAGILVGEALTLAVAAFAYGGAVRRALQRLKYGGAARLARPLADAAVPALTDLVAVAGRLPLVPVPLHVERRRRRGYNQAELLARALAADTGLPFAPLLIRGRRTTKQHRLDRAGRLRNLREAFSLDAAARPPPPAVIVVDDILTTGATLEACASVLLEAGCGDVYGFALAREI